MFTMDSFKIKGIFGHIFRRQTQLFPWFCPHGVQYYPWSCGLWFRVLKNHGYDPVSIEYNVCKVLNHVKRESSGETNSEDDISKIQERVVSEVFAETFPYLSERGVKEFVNLSKKYCDDKPGPKTVEDIDVSDINSDGGGDELCPKTWSQSVNGIVGNRVSENSNDELRPKSQEQDVKAVPGENKSSEVYLKSQTEDVAELLKSDEVGLNPQNVNEVLGDNISDELCLKSHEQDVGEVLGKKNSDGYGDEFHLRSECRDVNEVLVYHNSDISQEQNVNELLGNNNSDELSLKSQDVNAVLGDNKSDELYLVSLDHDVYEVLRNDDSDELYLQLQKQEVDEVLGDNNSDELYLKSQEQDVDELLGNNNSDGLCLKPHDVNEVLGDNKSDELNLRSLKQDVNEVLRNDDSDELYLKLQEQNVDEVLEDNNSVEICLKPQEQDQVALLGDNNRDELRLKPQDVNEILGDSKCIRLKSEERVVNEVSGNNNSDELRLKSQERDVKEVLRNNNSDGRGDECRLKSQELYVNEIPGNNNSDGRGDECRLKSQEWYVNEIPGNNNSDGLGDECHLQSQERDEVMGGSNGNEMYLKPQDVNEVLGVNKTCELDVKSRGQDANEVLGNNDSDENYLKLQEQDVDEVLGDNNSNELCLKPQDVREVLRDNKRDRCSDELGINSVSREVGNALVLPSKTTTVVLSDNNADFHVELDPVLQEQTVNEVLSVHSFSEDDERVLHEVSGNTDGEYNNEFDPKIHNRADMLYIKSQDAYMNGMLNDNNEFGPKSQKRDNNNVDSEHSSNCDQENCLELSERVVTEAVSNDNSACGADDTVSYSLERFVSGFGNVNCNGYGDNMVPYVSEVASISGYDEKRDCNLSDSAYSDSAYSSDPKIPEQCVDETVGTNSNSYEYDPISLKRVVTGCEGKISKRSVNKLITVTKIYYYPSVSYSDVNKVVTSSDKCEVKRTLARTHSTSLPSKLSEHCRSFADVVNTTLPVKNSSTDDSDDTSISEELSPVALPSQSPLSKSASPSPVVNTRKTSGGSVSSGDWPPGPEEDIERLVAIHQSRQSLSSLGSASPEPLSESTPTLPRAVPTSAESEPESTGAELRHIFSRRSSAPPRSDSLASVYSGAGEGRYGTVAVRGEVEFGLQYNYKAGALEILVKQCKDLAPVDLKRNRSDPYVKVYLLPDKSKSGKRKTKVKKHTLNPVFDETLKFHMTLHGLETRTLWLTVWHSDMFGRNDFLGEVMMPLENKVFDDPTPQWYPLQERTEPFDDLLSYKGDIIIGLKFVPPDVTVQKKGKRSRGSLHVLVKEAKNLIAVKANGTSDPFCKSYLLPDKGRSSKQKTPVLRRSCNPVWNYTFVYEDVSLQELSERSLELTVWDHDRLASNEFLGGLRFNLGTGKHYGKAVDWMDATGKEVTLWQSMLERPNFWVEGCLTLRPSLEQHRTS